MRTPGCQNASRTGKPPLGATTYSTEVQQRPGAACTSPNTDNGLTSITTSDGHLRSTWHARGRGQVRPCRARPADRSLVAEDRSAEGVRDLTGPHPRSVLGPWRTGTTEARVVSSGHHMQRGTTGARRPVPLSWAPVPVQSGILAHKRDEVPWGHNQGVYPIGSPREHPLCQHHLRHCGVEHDPFAQHAGYRSSARWPLPDDDRIAWSGAGGVPARISGPLDTCDGPLRTLG
jgi:hypothetical protein